MAVLDVLRGVTKGFAEAAGAPDAAADIEGQQDRERQKKAESQKFIMAPLVQAQSALTHRLMMYADASDPQKAQQGHEDEYNAVRKQLYDVSSQIHAQLAKPPSGKPSKVGGAIQGMFGRGEQAKDGAQRKLSQYNDQTGQQVQATVQGIPPDQMSQAIASMQRNGATPEQIEAYKKEKWNPLEAKADAKSNLKLYKLSNGIFAWLDATKPELIPDGATAAGAGTQGMKAVKGTLVRSQQSPTGFAQTWVDPTDPSKIMGWQPVTPSRFYQGTETERSSVDQFGVKTTSASTTRPTNQGLVNLAGVAQMPAEEGDANESAPPQAASKTPAIPSGAPKPTGPKTKALQATSQTHRTEQPKNQLDASGHIPENATGPDGKPLNQYLREAANNLIDGMDINKLAIPMKDRAAAQQVARQYGWGGQGLFSPKEQMLLRESETYLKDALNSPSLKVLDSTTSRFKLMNMLKKNPGMISDAIALKWKLTPAESEFLAIYNQLVGTVSGLAQLTRTGRPTEAAIHRLMIELTDPRQTQSSEQAKVRIKRLLSEIEVAKNTGGKQQPSTDQQGGVIVVTPDDMKGITK